jgi:hypothetical protein
VDRSARRAPAVLRAADGGMKRFGRRARISMA